MNRFYVNEEKLNELLIKYSGGKKDINNTVKFKLDLYNKNPKVVEFERYNLWIESIKESLDVYDHEEVEDHLEINEEENATQEFIFEDKKGNKKVSIQECANYFIENYDLVTASGKKEKTLYYKDENIWKNNFEVIIHNYLEEVLGVFCNNHVIKEVVDKIKRKTSIDIGLFNSEPEHIISIENGLLNLKTKELLEDYDGYYPTTKIPIHFNSNAKGEKILKFIEETFYPEDIPVIQEWLGFCLYKKYFIKKGMIFVGGKNTGKTVFLNLLAKFVGQQNIAGISLQNISKSNTFALSSLFKKMVNSYDDLSSEDLGNSGGFKITTGGGFITAEYKFGDKFTFKNYSKQIFATNAIPPVKDMEDDAYYERWIPLRLDNQVEVDNQDPFLLEKMSTKEELSGLFNWALMGLDRLLDNNKFSYKKTSEDIKLIMQRNSHPMVSFVQDALKQEYGHTVGKEEMFQAYTKYCNEHSLPRSSKSQLGRNLETYCNYIIAKNLSGKRIWENVVINIKYLGGLNNFS